MAIPEFQDIMLPLLRLTATHEELSVRDAVKLLGEQFRLTESELAELLPSKRQGKFHNRVGWAKSDLLNAALLEETGRARFRISRRGREVLNQPPARIDRRFLSQFPEYDRLRPRSGSSTASAVATAAPVVESTQTPEEILEAGVQAIRAQLARDLIERVKQCTPAFFERLVVDLLVAMGYGGSRKDAGQAVGQSGDGGIDGIIKEDRLGLDVVYIQAKRWQQTVGRPIVQAFAGSLEGQRARKGVLITTSQFSSDARDYVDRIEKKIVLIDGELLAQYMIDFGVGVAEVVTHTVKRIDIDYFEEA